MVATPLKWLQYYNMDGGDKSGVNWVVGSWLMKYADNIVKVVPSA